MICCNVPAGCWASPTPPKSTSRTLTRNLGIADTARIIHPPLAYTPRRLLGGGDMKSSLRILVLLVLVTLINIAGTAQEPSAHTVLNAALKAMGGENLRSIQYSGSEGYVAAVGQNYNPAADWPAPSITTYTRTIDYEARSSREEYGLTTSTGQGGPLGGGNAPVITTPIVGEQRRNWNVRENVAWNVDGTNVIPQPALAEVRQLEIWLTPHGCLKAALAPGANPIASERTEQGKGRIVGVSFMALGKYRVQCGIDRKSVV